MCEVVYSKRIVLNTVYCFSNPSMPFAGCAIYFIPAFSMTRKHLEMTIALLLLTCNQVPSVTANCTENQYQKTTLTGAVKCVDCPQCPVGYGLLVECGSNLTAYDRIDCKLCTKGIEFSSSHDYEQCRPCSFCSKDQVMTPCTPYSNTVCHKKCISKQNYYERSSDDCQQCTWCCGDADDVVEGECLKKGMPKHQSCTVHRKKKCTPAQPAHTSSTTVKSTEAPESSTSATQLSTIELLKSTSTLKPSNPTTLGFQTEKQGTGQEDKPDIQTIFIVVLATLLVLAIIIFSIIWNVRRKRRRPSTSVADRTTTDVDTPLVTVVQVEEDGATGTGWKLFDLFRDNHELKEKVCKKLDLQESFAAVAQHFKMPEDDVNKLLERPGDHPTRNVLFFVKSSNPNLLVTEFMACINKRQDVTELLQPYK